MSDYVLLLGAILENLINFDAAKRYFKMRQQEPGRQDFFRGFMAIFEEQMLRPWQSSNEFNYYYFILITSEAPTDDAEHQERVELRNIKT